MQSGATAGHTRLPTELGTVRLVPPEGNEFGDGDQTAQTPTFILENSKFEQFSSRRLFALSGGARQSGATRSLAPSHPHTFGQWIRTRFH